MINPNNSQEEGIYELEQKPQEQDIFRELNISFPQLEKIVKPKKKQTTKLLLFECSCGCKIRTARNKDKPLNAVCQYCKTRFCEVLK